MNVSWVFDSGYSLDPTVDIDKIKNIGSTWGSWKTWRSCSTDNVICADLGKARDLLKRSFQTLCNFYVPRKFYQDLGRPTGLCMYDGEFTQEINDIESIVALHLVAKPGDIVLLVGFDFRTPAPADDQYERIKIRNQMGLLRSAIVNNPDTQWVAVDHSHELDKAFQNIPNLTCDKMENVIQLLV